MTLPNARVLIHQPHGGAEGQSTDIQIQAAEMLHARTRIEELLADHTGQSIEKISGDIERDYIVRGADAVDYGLVDSVIERRQIAPAAVAAVAAG